MLFNVYITTHIIIIIYRLYVQLGISGIINFNQYEIVLNLSANELNMFKLKYLFLIFAFAL